MSKKIDVVEVKWVDSSFQHGWRKEDEFRTKPANVVSYGMLVRKDKDLVVVSLTYCADGEDFADGMAIPRCAIKSIEKIAEVSKCLK